ncbi:rRNA maturation RNase YbeY [Aquimarina sp. 2201CG1-2-11]|uniref:rRNA maturation RNase YbeY n=1 Tax=Aquimarina discodermiae TaxID=3231043 RepID=UPI00346361E8
MINFYYETNFVLTKEVQVTSWINKVVVSESKSIGEINFIFCDDQYLLKINQNFLNHDTFTDIISFDNSMGNKLSGDIYISIERVRENADIFEVTFDEELRRVMIHGVLHYCGYKDKSKIEKEEMSGKEDEKLKMFHVEH